MNLISISRQVHEHHTHEHNIIEKRAPTDESVRLLREMEAKAHESVTSAVRVKDAAIDCVVHRRFDRLNYRKQFKIIYSLNGRRRTVDVEVDDESTPDESAEELVAQLSRDIAANLLVGCMKSII